MQAAQDPQTEIIYTVGMSNQLSLENRNRQTNQSNEQQTGTNKLQRTTKDALIIDYY